MIPSDLAAKVAKAVDALAPEMVRRLQELIRIPSVVGQEAPAQEYMKRLYQELGLEVQSLTADRETIRRHPAFIDTGADYAGRPNLIAAWPGRENQRSLIINGHVDVVSAAPLDAWTRDPWGAVIEGDRLYGRGAGDMKAGLMANYFALKAIKAAGLAPKGSVYLQSVVDEEAGGAGGTLACLMAGHLADAFLCTEPHGTNVTVGSVGICHFRVRVVGRTAHGGLAHLGVNAFGKLIPIYQALEKLDQERGEKVRYPLFEKGSGRSCHLCVGTVQAGDWPSTVAGEAAMECRISFIPGESLEDIHALVRRTVETAARQDPWLREHPPQIEWFGWQTQPWEQDAEHPFVQTLLASAQTVAGRPVDFIGRASGLDARFASDFPLAASCLGPRAGNIHGIDEYVEISSVAEVCKIVALTTLAWCDWSARG